MPVNKKKRYRDGILGSLTPQYIANFIQTDADGKTAKNDTRKRKSEMVVDRQMPMAKPPPRRTRTALCYSLVLSTAPKYAKR